MENIQGIIDYLYATVKSGLFIGTVEGVLTYVSKRYRLDGKMITNVRAAQLVEAEARRLEAEAAVAPVLAGNEDDIAQPEVAEAKAEKPQSTVEELLAELKSTKNGDRKKVIRAKLRKLGYKLSDQK